MGMPETKLEYEKISIGQIRKQSIMELLFDFLEGGGVKFEKKNRIGVYCKKKKKNRMRHSAKKKKDRTIIHVQLKFKQY